MGVMSHITIRVMSDTKCEQCHTQHWSEVKHTIRVKTQSILVVSYIILGVTSNIVMFGIAYAN